MGRFVRFLSTYVPTANATNDLAMLDDLLAYQLAENDPPAVELLTRERWEALNAERREKLESDRVVQSRPRVIVRLNEAYGLDRQGEVCSFPPEIAGALVWRGQAAELAVVGKEG